MKAKISFFLISGLTIASFSLLAHAENGYFSAQVQSHSDGSIGTNGYSSRGSEPTIRNNDTYFVPAHVSHRFNKPHWVNMLRGSPIPRHAVMGGTEGGKPLFVCRGNYGGGMQPGKIVGHQCNIGWGGNEITLSRYQVLVSQLPLSWAPAKYGFVPANAIPGGFERNRQLYICQVAYNGGIHPGKIVGKTCNVGWGGREVSLPHYNVLVR